MTAASCERYALRAHDHRRIMANLWMAEETPRVIVQVLHGLAEHAARYAGFAQAAAERGFAVVAHDHRGHGEEIAPQGLGHFADEDGWQKLISDAQHVQRDILRRFPEAPLVLVGHSLGSYIAQSFVMRHPEDVAALVLSATTCPSPRQLRAGRWLARFESWRQGPRAKSRLLDRLGFGGFNRYFAPNRTAFDWLSRDTQEVDKYVTDALCGAMSTNRLWVDLTDALTEIMQEDAMRKVPATLPILITGGDSDPVGGETGLSGLAEAYRATGHSQVDLKLYKGGRHEMLHEVNRDEVTSDWLDWIEDTV